MKVVPVSLGLWKGAEIKGTANRYKVTGNLLGGVVEPILCARFGTCANSEGGSQHTDSQRSRDTHARTQTYTKVYNPMKAGIRSSISLSLMLSNIRGVFCPSQQLRSVNSIPLISANKGGYPFSKPLLMGYQFSK